MFYYYYCLYSILVYFYIICIMFDPLCDMLTEVNEYTTKLMKLAFENTLQSKSFLQFLNTTWRYTFPDEF